MNILTTKIKTNKIQNQNTAPYMMKLKLRKQNKKS